MGLLTVRDEWTKIVGHRFLNSQLCLWIGFIQALVCIWGVAQHGHSYMYHSKILQCDFKDGSLPLEAADAVIFDVGLFYALWGIRGCVAEYLDGGFGRLAWCVSHMMSLFVSLPFAFANRPRPCYLWPLLVQQSAYGICLLILLLAALPRILPLLTEPQAAPLAAIAVYCTGTALNFFLLYVYWHWYWHVASMWDSAVRVRFGSVLENANNRSRRDRPRLPKEDMPTFPASPGGTSELPSPSGNPVPTEILQFHRPLPPIPREISIITITSASDSDPPPPPPPIIAVRLTSNSKENRRFFGRRRLPPTPVMSTSVSTQSTDAPMFYLPNTAM